MIFRRDIVQTESGKMLNHLRIRHIPDQFIVHTAQEINNRVLFTACLNNINTRVIHRPLVVEERRINFEDVDEE